MIDKKIYKDTAPREPPALLERVTLVEPVEPMATVVPVEPGAPVAPMEPVEQVTPEPLLY